MYRSHFDAHLRATTPATSNKRTSYLQALNLLSEMLSAHPFQFADCIDIWNTNSPERLYELRDRVRKEQRKEDDSVWNLPNVSESYLRKGHCSAALTSYAAFLVEHQQESSLLGVFNDHQGDEEGTVEKLKKPVKIPKKLVKDLSKIEGKEIRRQVKARVNQRVFRKIILQVYSNRCCITGLCIPEINRASHIIPWAENKATRLDPRNGLCLSATYDAAFDRHLISLDDEYRVVLSKDLKENYKGEHFQDFFLKKEGQRIELPETFRPELGYLERHREKGGF